MEVPFYLHDLGEAELNAVREVLKGPILTTGATVEEFEKRFAALLQRRHALGVSNCTDAIRLSLHSLGVGAGDEVVTTAQTFVATAEAICTLGAKPVLVDVEADTGNMDVEKARAALTKKTKAIVPVHLYGLMCDMKGLAEVANSAGIPIVEDAAHCVEGVREGIRPGQLGKTACFSFFTTKNLTCGEGGGLVTDDSDLYAKLKRLRNHGMDKTAYDRFKDGYTHYDVAELGCKVNMSNIQAAFLLPQFERIERKLKEREQLATHYTSRLNQSLLKLPATRPDVTHARHIYAILVPRERRDGILNDLKKRGIPTAVNYRPVHYLTYFQKTYGYKKGDFPNAEAFGESTITLPFFPGMKREHIDYVCDTLNEILNR